MTKNAKEHNILMVTPRYFPYMGGIETHVHEVGRLLAQRGNTITVLTTMPSASLPLPARDETIDNMRIIRVQAWPQGHDYYIAPEVYSFIKKGAWDLIHCQGCHTFVPPFAMQAARQAHIPYILTFHTGGHSSNIRTMIRGIQWRLLGPQLAHASRLIGVSQFEATYFRTLLRLPERQFTVIPNGSTLPTTSQTVQVRPNQTLLLSVGRLERYKGHQRLIRALPDILRLRPDARLLIVGSGPYEQALRQLIQEVGVSRYVEIRAVKASDRQAMADLLMQASLVALLSDYEAHPIAVLEALALRRPVLVTDTSGLRELAEQRLVRAIPLQSSPERIALAVLQQLQDPIVPAADFTLPTWIDCADQLQVLYDTVINEKQKAS